MGCGRTWPTAKIAADVNAAASRTKAIYKTCLTRSLKARACVNDVAIQLTKVDFARLEVSRSKNMSKTSFPPRAPIVDLPTHAVTNQPPPLVDYNLFAADPGLREALARDGAGWAEEKARAFGAKVGSAEAIQQGFEANAHPPELKAFDRYGERIDEVVFHPAYHALMALGLEGEVHSIAWIADKPGAHVAHAALEYMLNQTEAGVCCPITMTYASIPALQHAPKLHDRWAPLILNPAYDGRSLPAPEKGSATIGMAMTEKQGGSDVRANTTWAEDCGDHYALTGHKWFCSAPMSDAFLTLAQTPEGLTCFLVPRWRPDGARNRLFIQRLKDKLGNRSNASAEIEYDETFAEIVGEPGRGVQTIMEMVRHTRLDCAAACAGMMRQGAVQAVWHAVHRSAFGKALIDQPLMKAVLADLVLESEAATALTMRVARAFDGGSEHERAFARIGSAIAKFWITKRLPNHAYEAMECLGGNGYVEESGMPRLYREAPVNAIWEGSGNVNALDVLRAIAREHEALHAYLAELNLARGADPRFDQAIEHLHSALSDPDDREARARRIVEEMAVLLQASLLLRHAPDAVSSAFIASRLPGQMRGCYGALPAGLAVDAIIERARLA
jgi:putative acyl-CoA dehydrogenase